MHYWIGVNMDYERDWLDLKNIRRLAYKHHKMLLSEIEFHRIEFIQMEIDKELLIINNYLDDEKFKCFKASYREELMNLSMLRYQKLLD